MFINIHSIIAHQHNEILQPEGQSAQRTRLSAVSNAKQSPNIQTSVSQRPNVLHWPVSACPPNWWMKFFPFFSTVCASNRQASLMGFSCDPMTVSSCCVHFPLHSVGWTQSPPSGSACLCMKAVTQKVSLVPNFLCLFDVFVSKSPGFTGPPWKYWSNVGKETK